MKWVVWNNKNPWLMIIFRYFLYLFNIFLLYWSLVDLQHCVTSGVQQSGLVIYTHISAFQGALVAKNPLTNAGDKRHGFYPLWEDPLEEGMTIHSNILTWRIPWTVESGRLQSIGSWRVGHNWSDLACTHVSFLFQILSHIDYCSILSRVPCI